MDTASTITSPMRSPEFLRLQWLPPSQSIHISHFGVTKDCSQAAASFMAGPRSISALSAKAEVALAKCGYGAAKAKGGSFEVEDP